MDHDQLLLAPYTPAQAEAQVDALPKEYGHKGLVAKKMINAYVDGVNAWVDNVNGPGQSAADLLDGDYAGRAASRCRSHWTAGRRRRHRRPDRRHLRQGRRHRGRELRVVLVPAAVARSEGRRQGVH